MVIFHYCPLVRFFFDMRLYFVVRRCYPALHQHTGIDGVRHNPADSGWRPFTGFLFLKAALVILPVA